MLPSRALVLVVPALAILSACIPTPRAYETAPIDVETDKGVVTCQLYREDLVAWDRAIDRPANMTVAEADAICVAEGRRRQAAS